MAVKRSTLLLISAIIGSLYAVYVIFSFAGSLANYQDEAELAGAAIATMLVAPHIVLVVLAVIFNWIAYFTNRRGLALTGAILYSVAGVLFIIYVVFVIPSIVLSFVGYAKLRKSSFNNL